MTKQLDFKKWWQKWSNYKEVPKQLLAEEMADKYGYLLYGGASGGGKSWFLRTYPIKFLLRCFYKYGLKGVRAGLFCEDYPSLWDRHISAIKYGFYPQWLGQYNGQHNEFILDKKYGQGVLAFRNLDDPSKYASAEFALIEVDELTKHPKETFDFLRWRKRWPGLPKTQFIAGTNPAGIGHAWVKQYWLDRNFPTEEKEAQEFYFVGAKADDNKFLDESYTKQLESLPEKLRKAFKDGNWDIFVGQYFTEWNKERHVIPPVPLPVSFKRFRAYDHGRENPACCLWFALDYDGRVYIYRELYARGLNVDQIAPEINRLSESETYEYSVADPAIFAKTGMVGKMGEDTIAQNFARHGIVFIPGSNRRVDGWNLVHQYLQWFEYKPPKILYFSTCLNSIRTIPSLIHDERKPEDIDTRGEDHACFMGGTLIDGIPIEYVGVCTGIREVFAYKVAGRELIATPNHPILTHRGLVNIDALRYDDIIWQKLLFMTVSGGVGIRTAINGLRGVIISVIARLIQAKERDCTGIFGVKHMEKSRKVFIFTILMVIPLITRWVIWGLLTALNTIVFTILLKREEIPERLLQRQSLPHLSGQKLQKEGNEGESLGIKTFIFCLRNLLLQKNVTCVVKYIKQREMEETGFVTTIADRKRFVGLVPVYNLKTKSGMYRANGIVVSNCDALRYGLMSLHERKIPPPKTEVEKILEAKRKQQSDLTKIYSGELYRDSFGRGT